MGDETSRTRLYLGDFVLGAVDGTITTFAIVAGIAGAGLEGGVIISLILGFANVLADGFSMGASNFLKAKSDHGANHQIESYSAFSSGLVTFFAFISIGSLPLIPFALSFVTFQSATPDTLFLMSAVVTALCFVATGALRARVSEQGYLKNILETLLIGGIAAFLAYGAGDLLSRLLQ